MNRFVDSRYTDGRLDGRAVYRAYERAYRDAEALFEYMYERWRNDPVSFRSWWRPVQDSKYGIVHELA